MIYSLWFIFYSVCIIAKRGHKERIQACKPAPGGMGSTPSEGLNEPIGFRSDASSKRKKGAHKPVFAPVFVHPGEPRDECSRVHLLVNPFAGKKRGRSVAEQVVERLEAAGVSTTCGYSAYSGHLVTMASALVVETGDIVAVVGGDGSF